MKKFLLLPVLALFLAVSFASPAVAAGEDDKASVMTVLVKQAKSPKKAEALKSYLLSLKGVKGVNIDAKTGNVQITYAKGELDNGVKKGCCSILVSQLEQGGWKYELVSNEEGKSGCSHSSGSAEPKKTCPYSGGTQKGS